MLTTPENKAEPLCREPNASCQKVSWQLGPVIKLEDRQLNHYAKNLMLTTKMSDQGRNKVTIQNQRWSLVPFRYIDQRKCQNKINKGQNKVTNKTKDGRWFISGRLNQRKSRNKIVLIQVTRTGAKATKLGDTFRWWVWDLNKDPATSTRKNCYCC